MLQFFAAKVIYQAFGRNGSRTQTETGINNSEGVSSEHLRIRVFRRFGLRVADAHYPPSSKLFSLNLSFMTLYIAARVLQLFILLLVWPQSKWGGSISTSTDISDIADILSLFAAN